MIKQSLGLVGLVGLVGLAACASVSEDNVAVDLDDQISPQQLVTSVNADGTWTAAAQTPYVSGDGWISM